MHMVVSLGYRLLVEIAPDQGLFPNYTAGKYVENGSAMIVSRGLGNSIIPQRIFNRPEVVSVTLHANDQ